MALQLPGADVLVIACLLPLTPLISLLHRVLCLTSVTVPLRLLSLSLHIFLSIAVSQTSVLSHLGSIYSLGQKSSTQKFLLLESPVFVTESDPEICLALGSWLVFLAIR